MTKQVLEKEETPMEGVGLREQGKQEAPTIQLKNVYKIYRMGGEKIVALEAINLEFYPGKIYCLLGVSGSGKSTLLNVMAGLVKPSKGEIIFNKKHIEKMNEKQLALFRQAYVGFIFQKYNLLPTLTALENVTLPLIFRGIRKKKRNKTAMNLLEAVGLGNRHRHKPSELSGGQQQRVSIARAYVNNPSVVFADEPTGNLDEKTTMEMMKLIVEMAEKNHQTLVIVTHNLELAKYADQIIHMRDGYVTEVAENERVLITDEDILKMHEKEKNAGIGREKIDLSSKETATDTVAIGNK